MCSYGNITVNPLDFFTVDLCHGFMFLGYISDKYVNDLCFCGDFSLTIEQIMKYENNKFGIG
jgi:hypothetical protein